jgi:predicted nucleotidyltransferase
MPEFAMRLARAIASTCETSAVLLFGSWAKGNPDVHSDVDLIVVLPARPSPAIRSALQDAVRSVPLRVDLLMWTPADVAVARADPHGFAGSALASAKVLLGALPPPGMHVYTHDAERT